jgi:hypothetical protein
LKAEERIQPTDSRASYLTLYDQPDVTPRKENKGHFFLISFPYSLGKPLFRNPLKISAFMETNISLVANLVTLHLELIRK